MHHAPIEEAASPVRLEGACQRPVPCIRCLSGGIRFWKRNGILPDGWLVSLRLHGSFLDRFDFRLAARNRIAEVLSGDLDDVCQIDRFYTF